MLKNKSAKKTPSNQLAEKANRKYKGSIKKLIKATSDKKTKMLILKALLTNPLIGKPKNFDDFLADYQYILKRGNMLT